MNDWRVSARPVLWRPCTWLQALTRGHFDLARLAQPQLRTRRRWIVGLVLILGTALTWVSGTKVREYELAQAEAEVKSLPEPECALPLP